MIELSATRAVAAMRDGDVSAQEYAEALLARCAQRGDLNAFVTLEPERVRAAAREADRRRAAGFALGLLHGLPVPVKDSINTHDLPTTVGTRALRGFMPAADAHCVERLRREGAIVMGKTNLHELSFGWTSNNLAFGAVRNPYDPSRIPGGSTGGTAAAVAARMAPLGIAEDTQGSIRVPAALCGICGFRPTTGRYPNAGTAPITPLFDQVGSHARAVEDLVLFDMAMTGDTRPLTPAPLKGLRLGLARDHFYEGLAPDVAVVAEDVLTRLREAGIELVDVALPGLADLVARVTAPIQLHDVAPSLQNWLKASGAAIGLQQLIAGVSEDVKAVLERFAFDGAPLAISEEAYAAARDVHRPAMQRLLADVFATHGIKALIFPATMTAATPIGQADTVRIDGQDVPFHTAIARNISPASSAGLPGLVLPGGLTHQTRLPVGVELDGPAGSDRDLLAIGLALETILPPLAPPEP